MNLAPVDRKHNLPGRRLVAADLKRVSAERGQKDQPPYSMDRQRREAVLEAVLDSCYRNWRVLAAHVRTTHAHLVVESEAQPERIMKDLKSYTSRHLNRLGRDQAARKRWARHGSTRWLWKTEQVSAAVRYVVDGQGERMSVFES